MRLFFNKCLIFKSQDGVLAMLKKESLSKRVLWFKITHIVFIQMHRRVRYVEDS